MFGDNLGKRLGYGYGIFQMIETSPIICHIPYPWTPSTIVLNTLVEHFVSMSGVNTMYTGWWVGENFRRNPSGSVFGVGCLLQLAGCWLEYDVGSLAGCRILSGI